MFGGESSAQVLSHFLRPHRQRRVYVVAANEMSGLAEAHVHSFKTYRPKAVAPMPMASRAAKMAETRILELEPPDGASPSLPMGFVE